MTPSDELQTSTGAYALNALNETERGEFEKVMADSEQLRAEVTELTDTAVELGASVAPVDPPASLRASILDAVAKTPQLPPLVEERGSGGERSERVETARVETPRHETARRETPAELKARSRWSTPLVRLGAVAAAVALIVGLGFTVRAGVQAQHDMATVSQINEIQASSDYQRAVVDVAGGGTATAVWSTELRRAALIVDGWKDLPAGSTYELWFMDADGVATPAGTFDVSDEGSRSIVLAGLMDAGDTIGVTVEPSGGSKTPSDQVVVVVPTA